VAVAVVIIVQILVDRILLKLEVITDCLGKKRKKEFSEL